MAGARVDRLWRACRRGAAAAAARIRLRLRRRRENRCAARRDFVQGRAPTSCPMRWPNSTTTISATSASSRIVRSGAPKGCRSSSHSFTRASTSRTRSRSTSWSATSCARCGSIPSCSTTAPTPSIRSEMRGLGFAGFRVHYAINSPKYKDEVAGVSRRQLFSRAGQGPALRIVGARPCRSTRRSARARNFRVRRVLDQSGPAPGAKELTIYALLDSRRVTGAYRFVVKPGIDTAVDVKARLFLRENVSKPGIAPLTSMYLLRREPARGPRRLPARGARLGRPVGRVRHRRMDLAAAGQSQAAAGHVVRAGQSARLRPACSATANSSTTRIWKRATNCARAHGSSPKGKWGTGPGRAGADSQSRRDQRQHRRLLGAGHAAGTAAALRHRIPHAVAEGRLRRGRRLRG